MERIRGVKETYERDGGKRRVRGEREKQREKG